MWPLIFVLCIELCRYEYDIAINTLQLIIHFSLEFVLADGALQRIEEVGVVCYVTGIHNYASRRTRTRDTVKLSVCLFQL